MLQAAIIAEQGAGSPVAAAVGRDLGGRASPVLDAVGMGLSFLDRWLGVACYILVALLWLVPDRRLGSQLRPAENSAPQPAPAPR